MSTTEHRPAPQSDPSQAAPPPLVPYKAAPRPAEPAFTDEPTGRIPVVPTQAARTRPPRPHRVQGGELAALAFAPLSAIPDQRGPAAIECRAAG